MVFLSLLVGCLPEARGCNAEGAGCTGSLAVDLTGERPVFELEGMEEAATVPDTLSIIVCPESVTIWEMWSIPEGGFPMAWGEVPEGSEHVEAPNEDFPFELVPGTRYVAMLGVRDADLDGPLSLVQEVSNYGSGASGVAGWSGSFVWGEPDSYAADTWCGGEDSGLETR